MQVDCPQAPAVRITGCHEREVTCAAWCPARADQLATCSEDSTVCVWNPGCPPTVQEGAARDIDDHSDVLFAPTPPVFPSATQGSLRRQHSLCLLPSQPTHVAAPPVAVEEGAHTPPRRRATDSDSHPWQAPLASRGAAAQTPPSSIAYTPQHTAAAAPFEGIESGWRMALSPNRQQPQLVYQQVQRGASALSAEASLVAGAPSQHGLAAPSGEVPSPERSSGLAPRPARCVRAAASASSAHRSRPLPLVPHSTLLSSCTPPSS